MPLSVDTPAPVTTQTLRLPRKNDTSADTSSPVGAATSGVDNDDADDDAKKAWRRTRRGGVLRVMKAEAAMRRSSPWRKRIGRKELRCTMGNIPYRLCAARVRVVRQCGIIISCAAGGCVAVCVRGCVCGVMRSELIHMYMYTRRG